MSFGEIVKRISPVLRKICHKLNGRFSYFDDNDLYQEALLHLWQDFSAGKLEGNTDSYILQGCYFYLKNYLRKAKDKTDLISIDASVDEENEVSLKDIMCIEEQTEFIESLDRKMFLEKIRNNSLTKKEKKVLTLFLEGLTVREIGRRLSVSHVRVLKIKANIERKLNYLKSDCELPK